MPTCLPKNINRTMRRVYLIVFLLLFAFAGRLWAAPKDTLKLVKPVKAPLQLRTDTGNVVVRQYSGASLNAYRNKPEFQYKQATFRPSLWERFWKWFWSLFTRKVASTTSTPLFWIILKYVFIVLGVGAIIFIIFRLLGVDITSVFRNKSASAEVPYAESLENIHEINFDDELERAINRQDYRLAVRLLYLRCLKQLNDDGLIDWEISKTNSTYINEIADAGKRSNFSQLTRQFEYVWYGEFKVDGPVFGEIRNQFLNFKGGRAI